MPPSSRPAFHAMTAGLVLTVASAWVAAVQGAPLGGCKAYPGYTVALNVDHDGDDLGQYDNLDQAASNCTENPRCRGFNSYGIIKLSVASPAPSAGSCLYTKITGCKPYEGYTAAVNSDHYGDDLGQYDNLDTAAAQCLVNPRCRGFNNDGIIKRVVTPSAPVAGTCLYTKITACKPYEGYNVSLDLDHDGDDLGQYDTLDVAASRCLANPRCRGFNSDGIIKRVVAPAAPSSGTCLYTKITACKPYEGYTAALDVDHDGDDLGQYDNLDTAASMCLSNPRCRGFNSDGITKRSVAPAAPSNGSCLYTKITACKIFEGYTVAANVDHDGDDLGQYDNLDQVYSKCTLDPRCRGFNSDGVLKRSVAPSAPSSGTCLYTKITACKPYEGYTVEANADHDGDDIGRLDSLDDVVGKCSVDPRCRGFNSDGYIKRSVAPSAPSAGTCLYTKITACKPYEGFTVEANADHAGDDMGQYDNLDTTASKCFTDPRCRGFNSDGILKRSVAPSVPSAGTCLYTRKTACTSYEGYTVEANADHSGDDLWSQYDKVDTAAAKCTADPRCRGFNSDGFTKISVTPSAPSNGTCLYTKITNCKTYEGYTVEPNANHNGDDLAQFLRLDQTASKCTAEPRCRGFNSDGVIKRSVTPSVPSPGTCLYTKNTVCKEYSGYTAAYDANHDGDNLGKYDKLDNAASKCTADARCRGFSSDGYTKRSVTPSKSERGTCLYTKITVCNAFPGYTYVINADHAGDDLGQYIKLSEAASKCTANTSCRGFNSDGVIKRSVLPFAPSPGTCLYTKVTVCKKIKGYNAAVDVDHDGDDIAIVPFKNAVAKCNADLLCRGFNIDGVLKRSVTPTSPKPGTCLYTKA